MAGYFLHLTEQKEQVEAAAVGTNNEDTHRLYRGEDIDGDA